MKKIPKAVLLLISLLCFPLFAQSAIDSVAVKEKVDALIVVLKKGGPISSFLQDSISFVYHEDNRCDGSTDGSIKKLSSNLIDTSFPLQVTNDGDGWGCDKKDPTTFTLHFNLKKSIKSWDRIECTGVDYQKRQVYIAGSGESDYLVLEYISKAATIIFSKVEFRSEDPG